jgi:hypothetical protein
MPGVVALGVILMRGFAGLLAYLAGVSAIFGIGIVGLMALQSPTGRTPSSAPVAAASYTESLAKPVKRPVDDKKTAHRNQTHKKEHVMRKQPHEPPFIDAGRNAYGYAQEPRRIDPNRFLFFGR